MDNLHLSYYTIPVRLDKEPDKRLLVHGYTGAIDLVANSCWEKVKQQNFQEISSEQIALLKQRGYLTNKTFEEEQRYVVRLANCCRRHRLN